MKKLFLTNTQTRKLEEFKPLHNGTVSLYVCGITPYDDTHLGHGRCYVTFDILFRLLKLLGYDVTYVRNFTDIDDKLINKAKEAGDIDSYKEIAQKYIERYNEDMEKLGCLPPDQEPTVTENMSEIISFIEKLIELGKAYQANGDVYFSVESFEEYGELSGRKLDDMISGARVEVDEKKKHPADFALWKGNDQNLFWNSPWGYGRPGWHIECSALAQKFLAPSIDIHGGGQDLIFPHHENEVAQSEALSGDDFVSTWVHNAFVTLNKEKMSKSLGNVFILREVFEKYDPMVVRFYYLQHHYKTPFDFSEEGLVSAEKAYRKILRVLGGVESTPSSGPIVDEMLDALCEDINTPKLFGILFENLSSLENDTSQAATVKHFLNVYLGLSLEPLPEKELSEEAVALIQERQKARAEKDWKRADEIRDKLIEMGVEVHDKKL